MTFMGYETPVEAPQMRVYNTDLMKMYIAGVKEQYEKGVLDYKDFMKMYNDFYSPIDGDNEIYHNATTRGALNLINDLQSRGIDPFRSPEARAAISKFIYSAPVELLNGLKQNAEDRKIYDQEVAKLRAAGKFNQLLEDYMLQQEGLDNFTSIDPVTGLFRRWGRLAPVQDQKMFDLISPTFSKYAKIENLGPGSRPFSRLMGVSDQNKAISVEASVKALDAGPWGGFFRKQAEDQVMAAIQASGQQYTPELIQEAVELQYRQNILDEANPFLQTKEEDDTMGFNMWKHQQDVYQKELDRKNDRDIAKGKKDTDESDKRTVLSQQKIRSSNSKAEEDYSKFNRDWWNKFIDKAVDYVKNNPTENGKKYKSPEKARDWWNKALSDPTKYNLIDDKGNWTPMMKMWANRIGMDPDKITSQYYDKNNLRKVFAGKQYGIQQITNAANKMYDKYVNKVTAPKERAYQTSVLTGVDSYTSPIGETGKAIQFTNEGVSYTPARRINLFKGGSNKDIMPKLQSAFNNWFNNNTITLYKRDNTVKTAAIPKRNGGSSIDVFGNADMTLSDFKEFYAHYYDKEYKNVTTAEAIKLARTLGFKVYTADNNIVKEDDDKGIEGVTDTKALGSRYYLRIPITRTAFDSDAPSYDTNTYDLEYEKYMFGDTGAAKMAITSEEEALGN